jgi:hypothetical protein
MYCSKGGCDPAEVIYGCDVIEEDEEEAWRWFGGTDQEYPDDSCCCSVIVGYPFISCGGG